MHTPFPQLKEDTTIHLSPPPLTVDVRVEVGGIVPLKLLPLRYLQPGRLGEAGEERPGEVQLRGVKVVLDLSVR